MLAGAAAGALWHCLLAGVVLQHLARDEPDRCKTESEHQNQCQVEFKA